MANASSKAVEMEIGPLLVEQRRVGDEFRIVENAVQQMHRTLAGKHLDPATRLQIEAFAISTTTELRRLGQRRLDLDASVCAANARAKLRAVTRTQ
jgi:predicted membrane GTPase involved in stress response